ncbi:MAG TPA: TolC family outer membrane protein [Nevskiaceae bacterium]|nr:TolC family outer membrane protein [Nevskiaceae bacterium]
MRLLPLALLAAALAPLPASANALLEIYRQAAQQDSTLQAARHQRDASLEARPQARAALLPQINGSFGRQESTEEGTEGFAGMPENPVSRDSTSEALTLTLNQALFDWAAFRRYAQAGDSLMLAQTQYRAAEQSLVLRVAQGYFNVLAAADALQFAQSQKAAVGRQLEQAQRRFEVGLSAITDVQEAQAAYDLTIAGELQAEQALATARQALAVITGKRDNPTVPLREEIPLAGPQPAEVDRWVDAALENNLDLLAAGLGTRIAEKDVEIARAGHYPTLGAQLQYQDATAEGSRFSGESETETVGLQLNLPIFSGGLTQSRVSAAHSTFEQRQAEQEGTRRGVEQRTRDAYLGVMSGAAQVRAYKQAVISSTTALEASETGFEVGTRTSVDVLNAQRDLFDALRTYARARYDYLLSVLTLKQAAGRLTESDLAEIDGLLVNAAATR